MTAVNAEPPQSKTGVSDTFGPWLTSRLPKLIESLHQGIVTIGDTSREKGILKQVIESLEGRMRRGIAASYEKAVNEIYRKLSNAEDGQNFTDILEAVARLNIDWKGESASGIREIIRLAFNGTTDPLLSKVVDPSQEGRALLAVAVAFGKSEAHVMELLAIRRSKAFSDLNVVNKALKKVMSVQEGVDYTRLLPTKAQWQRIWAACRDKEQ